MNNDNELELLQLQRSALIDTQTIFQILIEKEICTIDDILETRSRIEYGNPDVKRIDEQIESLGGTVVRSASPETLKLNKMIKSLANGLKNSK